MGQTKGPWTPEEDFLLTKYIQTHGEGQWRTLPKKAGLQRCGKGCRLRWMNYLRPNVKRGNISKEEEDLIIRLHKLLGNRWSLIAGRVPGRTDNEIKNYWNTRLSKKLRCKAVVNKTDYPRNAVSYSDLRQNVFQHANARDVPKREIFNTEYADVKMDCMTEKHMYSAAEDLVTSNVFNAADFIVYDNLQSPYTEHTVNYDRCLDMSDVFAGKFIYNEMDALNQLNQMCGVEETMFGASPHILSFTSHPEASLPGDLTASQHLYIGNGSDSSTALLDHQSSLLSAQGIDYSKGYLGSPISADQAYFLSTIFDKSNEGHTTNSLLGSPISVDQTHLLSTIFDECNEGHTTNSLLNFQGIRCEETLKPNAMVEPQSLHQEFLGNCFNQFLDSINGW